MGKPTKPNYYMSNVSSENLESELEGGGEEGEEEGVVEVMRDILTRTKIEGSIPTNTKECIPFINVDQFYPEGLNSGTEWVEPDINDVILEIKVDLTDPQNLDTRRRGTLSSPPLVYSENTANSARFALTEQTELPAHNGNGCKREGRESLDSQLNEYSDQVISNMKKEYGLSTHEIKQILHINNVHNNIELRKDKKIFNTWLNVYQDHLKMMYNIVIKNCGFIPNWSKFCNHVFRHTKEHDPPSWIKENLTEDLDFFG